MVTPSTSLWILQIGVDLAVLILVVEGLILGAYRASKGRGLPFLTVFLISVSGIGLLLALRAAVNGADPFWISLGLIIGGIAHAIDLFRRIKKS
jgi:hypothetical protein